MIGRCVANRPYMYLPLKGDTNDYSVNAQNPTNTSVATNGTGQFGEANGSARFDASTDKLTWAGSIADAVAVKHNVGFTAMYFCYFDSITAAAQTLLNSYLNSQAGFIHNFYSSNASNQWATYNAGSGGVNAYYSTAVATTWHLLTITTTPFDSSEVNVLFYKNATLEGQDSGDGQTIKIKETGNTEMRIGPRDDVENNGFIGNMHTFRIYNETLTQGQITI